jgi:hypothetical protein
MLAVITTEVRKRFCANPEMHKSQNGFDFYKLSLQKNYLIRNMTKNILFYCTRLKNKLLDSGQQIEKKLEANPYLCKSGAD